mmetsp:Transcript_40022/g.64722  ORF Transcript_40022/g.64722 Transcript_40022/m.64722 type:complete len:318 (-) Transcript_40022:262-1215(-)
MSCRFICSFSDSLLMSRSILISCQVLGLFVLYRQPTKYNYALRWTLRQNGSTETLFAIKTQDRYLAYVDTQVLENTRGSRVAGRCTSTSASLIILKCLHYTLRFPVFSLITMQSISNHFTRDINFLRNDYSLRRIRKVAYVHKCMKLRHRFNLLCVFYKTFTACSFLFFTCPQDKRLQSGVACGMEGNVVSFLLGSIQKAQRVDLFEYHFGPGHMKRAGNYGNILDPNNVDMKQARKVCVADGVKRRSLLTDTLTWNSKFVNQVPCIALTLGNLKPGGRASWHRLMRRAGGCRDDERLIGIFLPQQCRRRASHLAPC